MPSIDGIICSRCRQFLGKTPKDCPDVCPKCDLDLKASAKNVDMVNSPPHYQSDKGLEVIEVIEAFDLGYHLGNCIKYILRAGKKNDALEDLKKAKWYLERAIERRSLGLVEK